MAAVVLLVVVTSAGGGWFAGQRITSPAEAAARAAPPEPSLVTVPVERRVLSSTVVVRGTVRADQARAVRLAGGAGPEGAAVVTRPAEPGQELVEGGVAMEVSGRPVLVLGGEVPMYRDLRPGDVGDDVAQLEQALDRLGHDPGTVDRTYDGATEAAVARWYRAAGYEPAGPDEEERERVQAAENTKADADAALRRAEVAFAQASAGPGKAAVAQADAAVRSAEDGVASALAEAKRAEAEAAATVAQATTALEEARQAGDAGGIAAAEAALESARQAAAAAHRGGEVAVRQARDQVGVAKAQRAELDSSPEAAGARAELETARGAAQRAEQALAEARRGVGVIVPAAELVFLAGLPLRVESAPAGRGAEATGDVFTVAAADLVVSTSLSLSEADLVEVGAPATVRADDAGVELPGVVARIADRPGTDGLDAQHRAATITLTDAPAELKDASVRVTIPVESTDGEVLAVPLAAVSASADGTSRVQVEQAPGQARVVVVDPGLAAEGLVEVRVTEGTLEEGDQVVVGS